MPPAIIAAGRGGRRVNRGSVIAATLMLVLAAVASRAAVAARPRGQRTARRHRRRAHRDRPWRDRNRCRRRRRRWGRRGGDDRWMSRVHTDVADAVDGLRHHDRPDLLGRRWQRACRDGAIRSLGIGAERNRAQATREKSGCCDGQVTDDSAHDREDAERAASARPTAGKALAKTELRVFRGDLRSTADGRSAAARHP
jgi:hypothetical protein